MSDGPKWIVVSENRQARLFCRREVIGDFGEGSYYVPIADFGQGGLSHALQHANTLNAQETDDE